MKGFSIIIECIFRRCKDTPLVSNFQIIIQKRLSDLDKKREDESHHRTPPPATEGTQEFHEFIFLTNHLGHFQNQMGLKQTVSDARK